ncbi:MAG: aminoacetone oxidase family FAD-binding enzyme [Clostridia bacterium]|nr:aminoacetone oxidase family FAD-binding enzyme [Clostridia bacterium]
MSKERQTIGIIGGGAAGLMAACQIKKRADSLNKPVEIIILEKTSSVGNKLLLTGHGRCNITNRHLTKGKMKSSDKYFFEASNFMSLLLNNFDSSDTIKFFEQTLGVLLKEEENGRMFPVSDKALDIKEAMLKYLDEGNQIVRIITSFRACDIVQREDEVSVTSSDGMEMVFDDVVLATGGKSFSKTGSTGDGYEILGKLDHKIITPHASLAPIEVSDKDKEFTSSVAGVSVNVRASYYEADKKINSVDGDVLFTHSGLSGPAAMELSRDVEEDGWVELDFAPTMDDASFDSDLVSEINSKPTAKVYNIGSKYVPVSLSKALTTRAEVTDLIGQNLLKSQRKALVKEFKHLRLLIEHSPDLETAYVTRGGVDLSDIERKTMRSKKCKNLYIIGEVLNVDGKSGGYNLTACMSQAFACANSLIAEK